MSNPSDDALLEWIWLSCATLNAPVIANTLLKFFGSPHGVYEADEEQLEQAGCPPGVRLHSLLDKNLESARKILEYCREHSVGIVTLADFFYPERLKSLYNRPILLYYMGNFIDFDTAPCVAVVGARRPSEYGVRCAKRISYDLARAGAITVSGLAAGVDACAHKASLYNQSFTVGVLGCGIDVVYPKENRDLYEQVIQKGLILTEYPPSTPPVGRNFPLRNRIISGLSCACAVIEASSRSGALYTAEYALRQNRPLYSVPGSIFFEGSSGSNLLLTLGAKPLLSAKPLLDVLAQHCPDKIRRQGPSEPPPPKKRIPRKKKLFSSQRDLAPEDAELPPEFREEQRPATHDEPDAPPRRPGITQLNETQLKLFMKLSNQPVLPDELVDESFPVKTVLKTLTALEIKGFVQKHPGGKFSVIDEES